MTTAFIPDVDKTMADLQQENVAAATQPVDKFLKDISDIALVWGKFGKDSHETAYGTAHTILSMIDGSSIGSPPLNLSYMFDTDSGLPEDVDIARARAVFNADYYLGSRLYKKYLERAEAAGYQVVDNKVIFPPTPSTALKTPQIDSKAAIDKLLVNHPNLTDDARERLVGQHNRICDRISKTAELVIEYALDELEHVDVTLQRALASKRPSGDNALLVDTFVNECVDVAQRWSNAPTATDAAFGAVKSVLDIIDGENGVKYLMEPIWVEDEFTDACELDDEFSINSDVSLSARFGEAMHDLDKNGELNYEC